MLAVSHLTELQNKYAAKGVQIISITDEHPDFISSFVKRMGDKMDFTVACDTSRKTYNAYMGGFNQRGIPHAWVIDKTGRIVWHGHPMNELEDVLKEVIAGTWDIAKGKWLEEGMTFWNKNQERYFAALSQGQNTPEIRKLGETLVEKIDGIPVLLNTLSWSLLTDDGLKVRHLDLALKAGKRAYEGTNGMDTGMTDTYARALYDTGDKKKAIEIQREAIKQADEDDREDLQETLNRYLSGK